MSLALLQLQVDRAVNNASGYVLELVSKLKPNPDVNPASEVQSAFDYAGVEAAQTALPAELLPLVFSFLDIDLLVSSVQLVCKTWKAEVERYGLESRASRKLLVRTRITGKILFTRRKLSTRKWMHQPVQCHRGVATTGRAPRPCNSWTLR